MNGRDPFLALLGVSRKGKGNSPRTKDKLLKWTIFKTIKNIGDKEKEGCGSNNPYTKYLREVGIHSPFSTITQYESNFCTWPGKLSVKKQRPNTGLP